MLYDKFHEAEFARRDLGFHLPDLYHDHSDLIVVVICPDYKKKEWCGLEWDATFDLLKRHQNDAVMLCRFKHAMVKGLYSTAGFVELDDKTPIEAATLILQRLAKNEGKPRDHYVVGAPVRPGAITRDRKSMRLVSTRESIDRGEITLLAIVETLLAMALLIGLSVWVDSVKWLAGACALAPLLLLRTDDSIQRGLRMMNSQIFIDPVFYNLTVNMWSGIGMLGLCIWFTGWWTLLIVPCLGGSFIFSHFVPCFFAIRFGATAVSVVKHPLQAVLAIPENWRRIVLATDSHTSPEFLPGYPSGPLEGLYDSEMDITLVKWIFLTCAIGLYPITAAYRWSVKATCLIYLPLVWLVNRARFTPGSVRQTLDDHLADDIQRVRRVLAAVAISALAFKFLLLLRVDDTAIWAKANAPAWVLTILHEWNDYIVPHSVPLWQVAPAINGLLAMGLWLYARRVLRLKERGPEENTVLVVWRTVTTLSLVFSLYTIVCVVLITWRVGNLALK